MSERRRMKKLAALSIIEVLVATALISTILTTLAVNMIYSQRTIADAQLRTKATDLAESCLNRYRGLRDNVPWNSFCKTIKDSTNNFNKVCGTLKNNAVNSSGTSNKFVVTKGRIDQTGCSDSDTATVTVTIEYQNFHGDTKSVSLQQNFQKMSHEASY